MYIYGILTRSYTYISLQRKCAFDSAVLLSAFSRILLPSSPPPFLSQESSQCGFLEFCKIRAKRESCDADDGVRTRAGNPIRCLESLHRNCVKRNDSSLTPSVHVTTRPHQRMTHDNGVLRKFKHQDMDNLSHFGSQGRTIKVNKLDRATAVSLGCVEY